MVSSAESRREHRLAYMRAWHQRNPRRSRSAVEREMQSAAAREWQKRNPIRNSKNEYKKRSRAKGLLFTLPDALFEDLLTDNCFYCSAAPNPINGIDRVDNTLGYIEGNVVTACNQCNRAKNSYSAREFEAWAIRLADNLKRHGAKVNGIL